MARICAGSRPRSRAGCRPTGAGPGPTAGTPHRGRGRGRERAKLAGPAAAAGRSTGAGRRGRAGRGARPRRCCPRWRMETSRRPCAPRRGNEARSPRSGSRRQGHQQAGIALNPSRKRPSSFTSSSRRPVKIAGSTGPWRAPRSWRDSAGSPPGWPAPQGPGRARTARPETRPGRSGRCWQARVDAARRLRGHVAGRRGRPALEPACERGASPASSTLESTASSGSSARGGARRAAATTAPSQAAANRPAPAGVSRIQLRRCARAAAALAGSSRP